MSVYVYPALYTTRRDDTLDNTQSQPSRRGRKGGGSVEVIRRYVRQARLNSKRKPPRGAVHVTVVGRSQSTPTDADAAAVRFDAPSDNPRFLRAQQLRRMAPRKYARCHHASLASSDGGHWRFRSTAAARLE